MSQHIGPRTISAIGGSIKRVGNYRIHTFPSELVTDGLVMNLDAGDPRSLDLPNLNMTTWTDLSGNGNTGTLTNGPTYNNANGGSIVFNDSDDLIAISSSSIISGIQEFTIDAWIYRTTSTIDYIFGNYNVGFNGLEFYILNDGRLGVYIAGQQISASAISPNTWYHVVASRRETTCFIYINGILSTSGIIDALVPNNSNYPFTIGNGYNYTTESFTGRISSVKVYNRCLSAAEVAQNYDALKVRYTSYTNTFTPLCGGGSGKVEVLCVAGGGGGSVGGGGAGGLVYNSAFSANSNSAISLSIGTYGRGAEAWGMDGTSGTNSTFGNITAIEGGFGTHGGNAAGTGGSGGGGGYVTTSRASGTTGQGNAGGSGGSGAPNYPGGGGGGAGSIGADGVGTSTAGNGGSGLAYSISGTSQFYAGGGAGATQGGGTAGIGGSGVGGNGSNNSFGLNGIPNTGSGGGGSGQSFGGGNGSNGIVIVRYPATDYNVELLIVAGGGGGGAQGGGGGGAGGLVYYSSYPVSAGTKYSITVGAGGIGGTSSGGVGATTLTQGTDGANSIFSSIAAYGGGGGGSFLTIGGASGIGRNGASGGGGASDNGGRSGGSGILGQGNSGGSSAAASPFPSGGGGGAGASGGNGSGGTSGSGGIGLAYSITGTSTYYAGGGGGNGTQQNSTPGSGGLGGGGNGTNTVTGGSATANTGGGGGGSTNSNAANNGGAGGSGIIIIAYRGPQRGIGGTVDTTSRPGYTLHKFTTTGTDFFIP